MRVSNAGCVVSGNSSMTQKVYEANKNPMTDDELVRLYQAVYYRSTGKRMNPNVINTKPRMIKR